MTITTKYDLGQEVYFVDPRCAGLVPGKGIVCKLSFEQESEVPHLKYWVKMEPDRDPFLFDEIYLYASLPEFKDSMFQIIEEACKEFDRIEYD